MGAQNRMAMGGGGSVATILPSCRIAEWQRRDGNEGGTLVFAEVHGTIVITSCVNTTAKDIVQQHDDCMHEFEISS